MDKQLLIISIFLGLVLIFQIYNWWLGYQIHKELLKFNAVQKQVEVVQKHREGDFCEECGKGYLEWTLAGPNKVLECSHCEAWKEN